MIAKAKEAVKLNAKNLIGKRTGRKIVVFSVDDYGNVRLDSKKARNHLDKAGLKIYNRFDAYDTLETRSDLEMLFEVLSSVKDQMGRHALFTTFSVSCNINFERVKKNQYSEYVYELLPETFEKLAALQPVSYKGAWEMFNQGIKEGLVVPQFHGREHLNLNIFNEKLSKQSSDLMTCLECRSYSSLNSKDYSCVSPLAAFDFWEIEENEQYKEIINDGLNAFEKVYGYRAVHFTPPAYSAHPVLYPALKRGGVNFIDTALFNKQHQGKGRHKRSLSYTGKNNRLGQYFMVRNVVFEPTDDRGIDWVGFTLKQIDTAFRWNSPAIISSHRVNFCGHIDEKNRKKGLEALRELLKKITERWPEVEFMAANELGEIIAVG
jgi:hypothetical protein